MSSEQLLKRKNIQGAIDLLSKINPSDRCYREAKRKHAEILLKYRNDKHSYILCYKNVAENYPGIESYILLGDAYMKIPGTLFIHLHCQHKFNANCRTR